jgi:hypothetical protein
MSVLKAFMEVDDTLTADAKPFDLPPDPLGDYLERSTPVTQPVPATQVEKCFAQAVESCEKKMIAFLQDPETQRRLIRDLPLFSQED